MVAPVSRGENLLELFASAAQIDGAPSGITDLLAAVLAARPSWHADALCQEFPEVNFFPGGGAAGDPARKICARCLVTSECREWALAQGGELQGIWAGTSARQRRKLWVTVPHELRKPRAPRVRAPNRRQEEQKLRPTDAMERVSVFLAAHPGEHTTQMIWEAIQMGSKRAALALAVLAEEGYVSEKVGGLDSRGRRCPRARYYRHLRPYAADTTAA